MKFKIIQKAEGGDWGGVFQKEVAFKQERELKDNNTKTNHKK